MSRNRRKKRLKLINKKKVCFYCGIKVNKETGTIDHFMPKSKGGNNKKENIKLACMNCNTTKNNMHPEKWMTILPLLLLIKYMQMDKIKKNMWRKHNPHIFDKTTISKKEIKLICEQQKDYKSC